MRRRKSSSRTPAPPGSLRSRSSVKSDFIVDESDSFVSNLERNIEIFRDALANPPDLVVRRFSLKFNDISQKAALIYLEGLTDTQMLGLFVLEPLMHELPVKAGQISGGFVSPEFIGREVLALPYLKLTSRPLEAMTGLMSGDAILLLDRNRDCLVLSSRSLKGRNVEEPNLETVIRGPREGFTEKIHINIALLRERIASPRLRLNEMKVGRFSWTRVVVAYLDGVVEEKLVLEVKDRLSRIDIDGIQDSGYIEQLIEDNPFSIFPTVGNTEKPDVVAARLFEGRVAVLVDGSPVALTIPRLFYETIQTPEDYYSRPFNSSIMRVIRAMFLMVATTLPGFYVALLNYHPEMVPRTLAITVAASREGAPFPTVAEVILFGFIFEGLREAGVRMPRAVGSAITIVGALILGTAAIEAGLVSSSTVIVTAFVGIASFITPGLTDVFITTRFFLLILSSVLGFFGLVLGVIVVLTHLCSLRSFGVPYMSPMAPLDYTTLLKDIIFRAPLWMITERPEFITKVNRYREARGLRPEPPPKK